MSSPNEIGKVFNLGGGKTVTSFNGRKGAVTPQAGDYTAEQVGAVPVTRKVNNKPLSEDITLTASDVGAAATNHSHSGYAAASHGTHVTFSITAPVMDGTAAVGTASTVARSDHKHPTDTSRAAASHTHSNYVPTTRKVNGKALSADISLTASDVGAAAASHGTHVSFSTTAPVMDGTAAVGTASTVARSDHKHPTDTSRAAANHTHTAADVGALSSSGTAAAATKLATARTIRTNLSSTSTASFNGTANITPGVTGTLGIANGGTGATTAAATLDNLGVVGRSMAGKSVKPTSDTTVTAGTGAEIFNDCRTRTFMGSNAMAGNVASGSYSHAEGERTTAIGDDSHAEGFLSKAIGSVSHAEGNATSSGDYSHAEGNSATASGDYSHAEGVSTNSSGYSSHAEGCDTTASGSYSHAEGYGTKASSECQHVCGKYNVEYASGSTMFIIGSGPSNTSRSNCFRVTSSGVYSNGGAYNISGADYAELFEWADGNLMGEDRVGRFVTLDGDKIQLARPLDDYVLGIVSGNPSVVGDVYDDQWQGMYLCDIYGRPIWEDVEVPDETIEEPDPKNPDKTVTRVIRPAHTEHRQKLNTDYDGTKPYKARTERPEWDAVGLLGKLVAMDDGTCQVNGYCTVGEGGVATASAVKTRFRVMARLDEGHIRVMVLPNAA